MKHPKLVMEKESNDKSEGRKLSLASNGAQTNYGPPLGNKDKMKSKTKIREN